MNAPKLVANAGYFYLSWPEERIQVVVSRLRVDSKYNVSGEIEVTSSRPGTSIHLDQARCNLTSTASRRSFAKQLLERMADVDWHIVVEQVYVKVLAKYREGEPVIQLSNHSISERVRHRVQPVLEEKQHTVLFAPGDSGKSFLGLYWGMLVGSGRADTHFVAEPGNVLVLDFETDGDTAKERAQMIANGLGISLPENIYYRYCHQTIAADIEEIQRKVLELGIDFLLVDSATPAVGAPEPAQATAEYFRAVRSLRVTPLTIAHVPKDGKGNDPFGSVFWKNLPRANFKVNASHEPGASTLTIGLKHTKSNNGPRLKDIGLELAFDDDGVRFSKVDPRTIPDLAQHLPLKEQMKVILSQGKRDAADLADETGSNEDVVRTTLYRNKQDFVRVGGSGGCWPMRLIEIPS